MSEENKDENQNKQTETEHRPDTDAARPGLVNEPAEQSAADTESTTESQSDTAHESKATWSEGTAVTDDPFVFYDPQNHKEGASDDVPFAVLMEGLSAEDIRKINDEIRDNDNLTEEEKSEARQYISEALHLRHYDDTYLSLKNAPSKGWMQVIENAGKKIILAQRKLKPAQGRLSGTQALQYVNNYLGSSSSIFIPLWNSGFNVTVGNIKESEVQALVAKLNLSKAELGYVTRGALFSGEDSIVCSMVIDFFISHVITTSLKDYDDEILKQLILVSDLDPIMLGLLTAIHVRGYPINNTCVNVASGKCDYGTEIEVTPDGEYKYNSLLDFNKLLWVDRTRLTEEDIAQVGAGAKTTDISDVEKYQERHLPPRREVYRLTTPTANNGNVTFKLIGKHPSLAEHVKLGRSWVNSVTDMVNRVITDSNFETRNEKEISRFNMMMHFAKSTSSGRHLAWIKELIIEEGDENSDGFDSAESTKIIDGHEAIREILSEAFSTEHSAKVDKALVDFKDRTTLTLAGLPNYECPKCHHGQAPKDSRHPTLIPINVLHYFFIIGGWKYQKTEMKDY